MTSYDRRIAQFTQIRRSNRAAFWQIRRARQMPARACAGAASSIRPATNSKAAILKNTNARPVEIYVATVPEAPPLSLPGVDVAEDPRFDSPELSGWMFRKAPVEQFAGLLLRRCWRWTKRIRQYCSRSRAKFGAADRRRMRQIRPRKSGGAD